MSGRLVLSRNKDLKMACLRYWGYIPKSG